MGIVETEDVAVIGSEGMASAVAEPAFVVAAAVEVVSVAAAAFVAAVVAADVEFAFDSFAVAAEDVR